MKHIRNFAIIAHIDHGKSTLADRMLEVTGTIEARKMKAQVLDSMELERERGITIKMQPVKMHYTLGTENYELNLIDTPGHIDFAYEVSRALNAIEGVVLLVDATQGIQAQTLSVLGMARQHGLVVIPALSKIDSPLARVDDVKAEIALLLGVEESTIITTSGKTGEGVRTLLDEIVRKVPPPHSTVSGTRALIFDFQYSEHRGVILFVRIVDGTLQKGTQLRFAVAKERFTALEVGIFAPDEMPQEQLGAGSIGYIVTGIKKPGVARVGDTVLDARSAEQALPGYETPSPVIWASVYPESQDDLALLRQALERLRLTDSSLSYEEEASGILGRGFRCGFLGMLHMEIITERLRREFTLELIVTLPTTAYEVTLPGKETEFVYVPTRFPDEGARAVVRERWVRAEVLSPAEYIGGILELVHQHEGSVVHTDTLPDGRTQLTAEMPLRELMRNFFDKLKNVSSGFASLSYQETQWRAADVVRLEVLVAEEVYPAFSRIVSRRRLREEAEDMVERLHEFVPRQQFELKIQARADGRIIASRKKSAMRKDVTGYLYGGDVSRKLKLLQKQKKGKKKMLARGTGKVHIPHDVFMKVMKAE